MDKGFAVLEIDPDFKTLIRPLRKDEYLQLEVNLAVDGCREPIITWNNIIIDGHNRYEICNRLHIPYAWVAHETADTIADCDVVSEVLGISICKNLFLCNRQKTQFYLLMLEGEKVFKTKDLSKQLGVARLSFADPADMEKYLDITPGSVSVLGLMNDPDNAVQLVIDRPIAESASIGCHPCINSSTLAIATADILEKFLPAVHPPPILVAHPDPE